MDNVKETRNHFHQIAKENNWQKHDFGYYKDGFEVFFYRDGGFELSVRNPETTEKEAILEREDFNSLSPAQIAIVQFVLENAEIIVSGAQDSDN